MIIIDGFEELLKEYYDLIVMPEEDLYKDINIVAAIKNKEINKEEI